MTRGFGRAPAAIVAAAPNRLMISIILMMAVLTQTLDTTIVNVALPHMQGSLGATQDQIAWVLTSYIVAAAIVTPCTGWLAARMGRTRLFIVSLAGFTTFSLFCGVAGTIEQMVVFRILQGAFGATLMPLAQAIMLDTFPRKEIAGAMAVWSMGSMLGPIMGPTIGGYLTEEASWRWCFYINLPIGVLGVLGAIAFIPESLRNFDRKFDWLGFAFLTIAIAAMQLILDRGEQKGWLQGTEIKIEAVLALFGLYMFIVHSLTVRAHPFVDLSMFRDRNFVVCIFLMIAMGGVLNGSMILAPELLQNELGYPVITTGLLMGPRGLGAIISMMFYSRLANRVEARVFIGAGLILVGAAMYVMSGWSLAVEAPELAMTALLQGIGSGFIFGPMTTLAFSTLPIAIRTDASGFYALVRNIGGAIGISVVTSRLIELTQSNHAYLGAFFTPFRHQPDTLGGSSARAMEMLNFDITLQAGMVAYVNVFRLLAVLCFICTPLLLMLRFGRNQAENVAGDAALH